MILRIALAAVSRLCVHNIFVRCDGVQRRFQYRFSRTESNELFRGLDREQWYGGFNGTGFFDFYPGNGHYVDPRRFHRQRRRLQRSPWC